MRQYYVVTKSGERIGPFASILTASAVASNRMEPWNGGNVEERNRITTSPDGTYENPIWEERSHA